MTALNRRDNIWSSVEGPVSSDGDIVCVRNKRSNPSLPLLSQSERVRYFENATFEPETAVRKRQNRTFEPESSSSDGFDTSKVHDRTRRLYRPTDVVRPNSQNRTFEPESSSSNGSDTSKNARSNPRLPVRSHSPSARIRQNRTFEPEPPPASNAGQRRARASCEIRCIIDGLP
jgi:hypothetical protein